MSDQTPEAQQLQLAEAFLRAQITALEAERVRTEAERVRVEAECTRIANVLAQTKGTLAEMQKIGATVPIAPVQEVPEVEAPNGGLLTDAIAKYLVLVGKQMKTVTEIWTALEKSGFKILSGHPTRAVNEALRKRAIRQRDVFKAGGRWGATENFSNNQVRRITKKHAGMGGRSADEHGGKTRDGMQDAKARGVHIGAPLLMTPERMAEARRRLAAGEPISRLADEWGISRQTLYVRFSKKDIAKLREEAKAATDETGRPSLRIVRDASNQ